MLLQFEEIISVTSIFSILVLFLLMIIMIIVYAKMRVFLVILVIFLFSIVMGMTALQDFSIPFSPYLQIFFLMFQTVIFILTSLGAYNEYNEQD